MQIALFTDTFFPQVNGVSQTLKKLVDHLEHRNIRHQVFVPEFSKQDMYESNIHRFASLPFYLYPECRIALPNPLSIRHHLREFQPDLIHVATPFNMGLCGLHYGKKFGIPIASSYHTHFDRYLEYYRLQLASNWIWRYLRWFHDSCETTLVPSQETMDQLIKRGFSRVHLWTRGVDCDLFHPAKRNHQLRDKLRCGRPFIFLYVGRMAPEKDLDILLEIMSKLPQPLRENIQWVMVGDGPILSDLQQQVPSNVTFTGSLRGEELAEVYASADLFVFPSTTETFGNVVLEALASGIPAIGADAGGVKEIIRHGKSGILCQPRNSDAFIHAITHIMEKKSLLCTMGHHGRRFALTRSWEAIFDSLLAHYEQMIPYARKHSSV